MDIEEMKKALIDRKDRQTTQAYYRASGCVCALGAIVEGSGKEFGGDGIGCHLKKNSYGEHDSVDFHLKQVLGISDGAVRTITYLNDTLSLGFEEIAENLEDILKVNPHSTISHVRVWWRDRT